MGRSASVRINGHGSPPAPIGGAYWKPVDIARGVALVPTDARNPLSPPAGGYVLDGWGALHYFAIDPNVPAPVLSGTPYWKGWDIARGVTILTDSSGLAGGYILDAWGGLHPFAIGAAGTTPRSPAPVDPATVAYWKGWSIARGITALPGANVNGAVVIDGWGGPHPFALGSGPAPDRAQLFGQPAWPGADIARGMSMVPGGQSGCLPGVDWTSRLADPGHGSRTSDAQLTAADVGTLTQKWRLTAPGCNGAPTGGGCTAARLRRGCD